MIKKNLLLILFLAPGYLFSLETLDVDWFIKEAVERNPKILSLKRKLAADKYKIDIEKSLDYPIAGVEFAKADTMFSLEQTILWPGRLSLKGKVAESEYKMTEQELNSEMIATVYQSKKSFWMYWLTDRTIDLYSENISVMKRFLNIAKTHYAVGKVTQTDILKANSELSKMESILVDIEQSRLKSVAELNSLVNKKPDAPVGKPSGKFSPDIDVALDKLISIAHDNLPKIKFQKLLYEKNIYGLGLTKLQWFPDIMAGVKFSAMENIYMLKMPVPLYFGRQIASVKSFSEEKESSVKALESSKANAARDIQEFLTTYDSKKKIAVIYETSILPLAKQTLEITESAYRTGKNDFLDLLDSQKRYLDYNIEYIRVISEKEISLAELEKAVGVSLAK